VRWRPTHWFLDYLFDRFRWYRRWIGGRWERWYLDYPVHGEMWERRNSEESGPPPLARGGAVVEDYSVLLVPCPAPGGSGSEVAPPDS
jgi:hypothetical protein